ncbi:casein kinase I-like [Oppia nitens]|uniref:casein kinase I-like n=1 Tax=Oppia nitens TaxID=1686743 RepID=UPI0023DC5E0E|nr:casein kinase I-like [Oppia nitens]
MENSDKLESPEGKIIDKSNWKIGRFITGGSYGRLHLGRNTKTGKEAAIKLEARSSPTPTLPLEFSFYKILKQSKGVPKIYYFGKCDIWSALVMDLLGPSLKDVFEKCDKFSIRTTTQLAIQLIGILEDFHGHRLVYRDTKPENFLLGPTGSDTYNVVHIIDFGLCKEYKDENTGQHIPMATGKPWTGTVRYMSINNHMNREQSRRDDLESMAYMLVFLHKGELPWQGIQVSDISERYRKIGEIKHRIKPSELCAEMPEEYEKFVRLVRNLSFEEEPNYKAYINMFTKVLTKMGNNFNEKIYDWDRNHKLKPSNKK